MFASILGPSLFEALEMEDVELHAPGTITEQLADYEIILPSSSSWRNENYYRLVEVHRNIAAELEKGEVKRGVIATVIDVWKLYVEEYCVPLRSPSIYGNEDTASCPWQLMDLGPALKLISNPKFDASQYDWQDIEEQRRVFTLAYDVLRFKTVLRTVLDEINFFEEYPQLSADENKLLLIVFDFHARMHKPRDILGLKEERFLKKYSFVEVNKIVCKLSMHLAATFARVRVKRKARTMEELLPIRLRSRTVHLRGSTLITGFVNTFKTNFDEIRNRFSKEFRMNEMEAKKWRLQLGSLTQDHIVPFFLNCCPLKRAELLNSNLVKFYHFIIQDRSTCIGALMLYKILENLKLSGDIVQTNIFSPPASAYIACLFSQNSHIKKLLIFGAHDKKQIYQDYFKDIGTNNVEIYSEDFTSMSADSNVLSDVVAILATPSNSYTTVLDPVDVVISRNFDVQLLHDLTDDKEIIEAKEENLQCQKQSLLRAMSIPQVQVIVYETHSNLMEENENLVNEMVNLMNQYAADKHYNLNVSSPGPTSLAEQENADQEVEEEMDITSNAPTDVVVQVPMCDLFEVIDLPDLCPAKKSCLNLKDEGVYLSVIQRKDITRIDSKYMIKMAEERGLFGKHGETTNVKLHKKQILRSRSSSLKDRRSTKPKFEIERLGAPTLASLQKFSQNYGQLVECSRFCIHMEKSLQPRLPNLARSWWQIAIKHIKFYKNSKRKLKVQLVRLKRPYKIIKKLYPISKKNVNFQK